MTATALVSEIACQIRGVTFQKADASGSPLPSTVGIVRAGNIVDGELTLDDLVFVPEAKVAEKQILRANDVLIAASSGSSDVVGKAARIRSDQSVAFGGFCKVLRPGPAVDPGYFAHYFQTQEYRNYASAMAAGANINNLKNSHLDDIEIPLPPIIEQRRIAAILDAADVLRVKRRHARAKLDTLTEAIFLDMYLANDAGQWPFVRVADLALGKKGAIRTGPFGSQLLHEEFTDSGVAVLGIDNAAANEFRWERRRFISEEKYAQLRKYTVHAGDVLVTIMGTCGRVAIVPDDIPTAINTKHLCCISLDQAKCHPRWLWACFRFHPRVVDQLGATHGAVMPGLNMGKIKDAEVPVPPIAVQGAFAESFEAVQKQLAFQQTCLQRLDTLFASLQQRAFRGDL